jgi:hypothetical protein
MSRHTRAVPSALLPQALAPLRADPASAAILLDIDGTLAPIVEHAGDANVPEATRQLLIAVARRYGLVACVSGRRASEARAMVSIGTISYIGSHGAELLRAGWTEPVLDPVVEDWARRIQDFGREADTPICAAAGCGSRTRARSSPSTGAARPTRSRARGVDAIARAPRRRAAHPLGTQGARGPPAGADRQGRRRHRVPRGRAAQRRALRRRRHHRRRRLPRARARWHRRARSPT